MSPKCRGDSVTTRGRRRCLPAVAGAVVLALIATGCQTGGPEAPTVRKPSVRLEVCDQQLQDLGGDLLLYWRFHHKLPAGLGDLKSVDPAMPPTVCPVSGKPYVYRPEGVRVPGREGLLVLYDPEPSHTGMRWGVFLEGAEEQLVSRVILLPETLFKN
jgi:hypothetical protein